MKQSSTSRAELEADYATRAVAALSSAWMRPRPNRSGMRAEFRRWRPTAAGEPTLEMSRFIWGWMGVPPDAAADTNSPAHNTDQSDSLEGLSSDDARTWGTAINHAAVVVALRAVAGDHPPAFKSIGAGLNRSGISDLRLMRFLTAPRTARLETLYRICQLLNAKRLGVRWDHSEVKRILRFLYGTEEQAQHSANHWASDFFASRGKTENDRTATPNDESSTVDVSESTEPSTTEE
jgi:hypothetical protein